MIRTRKTKIMSSLVALFMVAIIGGSAIVTVHAIDVQIRPYSTSSYVLNARGTSVYNGDGVCLYGNTGHSTQKWRSTVGTISGSVSFRSLNNTAYALNRATSTGYAIMWTYSDGYYDSDIKVSYNSGYIFTLARTASNPYPQVLRAQTYTSEGVVAFSTTTSNHKWKYIFL